MRPTRGNLVPICAALFECPHRVADARPIGAVSVSGTSFFADGGRSAAVPRQSTGLGSAVATLNARMRDPDCSGRARLRTCHNFGLQRERTKTFSLCRGRRFTLP